MKEIISIYSALFILILNMASGLSIAVATEQVEQAKSYKTEVVAEIENSNFNPTVIDACRTKAAERGYTLSVESCVYDAAHDIQTAEVVLTYKYAMPLFGVDETRTTRGIAR